MSDSATSDARPTSAAGRRPTRHGTPGTGRRLRALAAAVGALLLLVAAVIVARAGVTDHRFPAYVEGHDHSVVTSYSGPQLAIAAALGTIAGLLLVAAVTLWWRARRPGSPPHSEGVRPAPVGSHVRLRY